MVAKILEATGARYVEAQDVHCLQDQVLSLADWDVLETIRQVLDGDSDGTS
jgi:hypothetical protein